MQRLSFFGLSLFVLQGLQAFQLQQPPNPQDPKLKTSQASQAPCPRAPKLKTIIVTAQDRVELDSFAGIEAVEGFVPRDFSGESVVVTPKIFITKDVDLDHVLRLKDVEVHGITSPDGHRPVIRAVGAGMLLPESGVIIKNCQVNHWKKNN